MRKLWDRREEKLHRGQADGICANNRFALYDRLEQRHGTVYRPCHSNEGWDGKEKSPI